MQLHDVKANGSHIRRNAFILIGVLAAGFLGVFVLKYTHSHRLAREAAEAAAAPPLVEVITVAKAPSATDLSLPGETAAWYESTIYARVDGYVGTWSANIGDRVKKGQVLATIETPELDAQLTAAKAKLVAAQADAELAKTTYARWRDAPKGVVSEQEREEKKAAYASAQARVALDKAELERIAALAKFKRVTAPYDGRITERKIDIGNLVTAGSNASTTPLYHMTQNNPMRIIVDAPQVAAADLKKGVDANITVSTLPNRVFTGKIARTADAINPESRTLRVEVDIPNQDQALSPGMYVDVKFGIPSKGLPQIPAAALVFRSSGPQVAKVDQDNHVNFQQVTIARDNGSSVEIASGVAEGDRIALNISTQVNNGDTVQINSASEEYHAAAEK